LAVVAEEGGPRVQAGRNKDQMGWVAVDGSEEAYSCK
jgi:hypothetical protein